jgi:hypothetical protein
MRSWKGVVYAKTRYTITTATATQRQVVAQHNQHF